MKLCVLPDRWTTRILRTALMAVTLCIPGGCTTKAYPGPERTASELVTLTPRSPTRDRPSQMFWRIATLGNLYWKYWTLELVLLDGIGVTNDRVQALPGAHTVTAVARRGLAPLLPPYELALWECRGDITVTLAAGDYEVSFNYDTKSPEFTVIDQRTSALLATQGGTCTSSLESR